MKATIVLVNHNGGEKAARNIRLIAEHASEIDAELIVVDNASRDGSQEKILGEVPKVRLVLEKENRGYAAGVNRGIREGAGDLFILLNPDAVPRPGSLRLLAKAAREHPGFAIAGGVLLHGSGRVDGSCARRLPRPIDILREGFFLGRGPIHGARRLRAGRGEILEVEAISGAALAIRAETLRTLGGMDESFFLYDEDTEWCRRARRMGMKVGVVPGSLFEHEGGASTRRSEGSAFAARLLSDFHYFCEKGETAPERIRRLWRIRLLFRSLLYRMDARLGILGHRPGSRRRAAIYRILHDELARFRWRPAVSGQSGHPSRIFDWPDLQPADAEDRRPVILQVLPDMDFGGAQRVVQALVESDLSKEYRFDILCLREAGRIGEDLRKKGTRVFVAGLRGWRSFRDWRRASDFCELLDADLVHSHLLPGQIAAFLGFRRRTPFVTTFHSSDLWMSLPLRMLERFLVRRAVLLAVSDPTARAKKSVATGGALPVVVPIPPTIPYASVCAPLFPTGRPARVLFLGRLHPVKRPDLFVRTAAELDRRFPGEYEFRIVGTGREEPALRELAHRTGAGAKIDFRGPVAEVVRELDEADVVLLTSDFEGRPLVLLETIARGRIPIVRAAPGSTEAVPPMLGECLIDSSDPKDFADRIQAIRSDPERYRNLAGRAKEWLREGPDFIRGMRTIYAAVLGRGGAPPRRKVLHLITRLIVGGAQETAIAAAHRLDPAKYEVHLWTGPQTGAEGSLFEDARRHGILPRVIPNLVREIHPWKDLVGTFQLARLMRRERFDIVHTHSSKAGMVGRAAAKLAGVPCITHTFHGWGFHEHMSSWKRALYVLSERVAASWANPLISVSEKTTRIGLQAGIGRPASYRLIRSGIPLSRFHPDPDRRREYRKRLGLGDGVVVIGTVGRLSAQKNPMDFVRVAETLAENGRPVRFLYVGDGPLRPSFERAVNEAGLEKCIRLLGLREDVPDLLRAFDLFILTSLWEGLPRVVPQALATGLPVLAYNVSGVDEILVDGKNGFLVPPGSPDEMAAKLLLLTEDPELRRRMSDLAVREFDWTFSEDSMVRDTERLYDEMTAKASAGD